jgi:integrase/recombinase XerD
MKAQSTLGSFLHAYFEDHLRCHQGVQPTTVRSYRDAIRLFLQFVANEKRCKLTRLGLSDMTCNQVLQFLSHLEEKRGNAVASRNQRLAALRNFFEYLANRVPEMLAEAQRVAGVPIKRTPPARTHFLERDEIETLFQNLPTDEPWALRDRALLLFLYNTGARVQEVAELRVGNLELGEKPRVHLHGKGNKWRICPLWKQSVVLLKDLLANVMDNTDAPVFVSRTGKALTRFGIYKIVRRHTGQDSGIAHSSPISPHAFRHYLASQTM